jgi:predicted nucleic acid-binding protein
MILLDTNLLCSMTRPRHPQCAAVRHAMHILLGRGEQLAVVPQNLYEFWAVATRMPAANGLGLNTEQASQWLDFFRRRFTLLPDREDLPVRWHELVRTLGIKGFRSHDARLAAAMQCYGISRLLTLNSADFKDMPVTVVDPSTV